MRRVFKTPGFQQDGSNEIELQDETDKELNLNQNEQQPETS